MSDIDRIRTLKNLRPFADIEILLAAVDERDKRIAAVTPFIQEAATGLHEYPIDTEWARAWLAGGVA